MTIKTTSNSLTKIYRSKWNLPGSVLLRHTSALFLRGYATQTSFDRQPRSSRKQVTVVNDDGRVQWKDLSIGEKAARTTQQTFNFGVVLTGFIMTVYIPQRYPEKKLIFKIGRRDLSPVLRRFFHR